MPSENQPLPLFHAAPAPAGAPIFERIGVVGLGLIGGSIALAARQVWPSGLVIGVDTHQVLEQAVVRHVVDVASSDLAIVSEADLVVLAAPIGENLALLAQLPDYLDKRTIVTDVGSAKRAMLGASHSLPGHLVFVGGHPLAGSTGSGLGAARPDLFSNRPWLFTPEPGCDEEAITRLQSFAGGLGAIPRVMDAAAHDHLVAFISHLPQLATSALMAIVGEAVGADGLALTGRGLMDTTRLAGSPAGIWADICRANVDEIRPAIVALIEALDRLSKGLEDRRTIHDVFDAANHWRGTLAPSGRPAP